MINPRKTWYVKILPCLQKPISFVASQLSLPPGPLTPYSPILVLIDQIEESTAVNNLVLFDQETVPESDDRTEDGDRLVYQCVLCKQIGLEQDTIEAHFKKTCPKFKVKCRGCKLLGERHLIKGEHKETCELITIQCEKCKLSFRRKAK